MPQHRVKDNLDGREGSPRRPGPYDGAGEYPGAAPSENHVAALQNLIYARFAAGEETISPLADDNGPMENTIALVSRLAGVAALVAAMASMAYLIF